MYNSNNSSADEFLTDVWREMDTGSVPSSQPTSALWQVQQPNLTSQHGAAAAHPSLADPNNTDVEMYDGTMES
jgi:hypothetical protein